KQYDVVGRIRIDMPNCRVARLAPVVFGQDRSIGTATAITVSSMRQSPRLVQFAHVDSPSCRCFTGRCSGVLGPSKREREKRRKQRKIDSHTISIRNKNPPYFLSKYSMFSGFSVDLRCS